MPKGLDWVELVRGSKPMIAAVNGAAVGIGLTQILPFDMIVASEKARFGMLFIKVGLVPELASTHFLVQRMGFGAASEMCLSGRLYSADEALRTGLIERVAAPEALLDTVFEIAGGFTANPPPQLLMTKKLLTQNAAATDLKEIQRRESQLLRECWQTPEHKEAVAAFIEKREPKFR
jgi:enoyl-CoA hydratase/carnithine racemase